MTETTTTSVQLVKGLYEAFARGDVPAVLAAMDEHIEWYEAEGNPWHPGHAFVGPQQVVEGVFARIGEEYEDFAIDCRRFVGDGDTVLAEVRYTATRSTATGKPLDLQVAHVWDLRDGKVVRYQQYADTRRMADVLGVSSY